MTKRITFILMGLIIVSALMGCTTGTGNVANSPSPGLTSLPTNSAIVVPSATQGVVQVVPDTNTAVPEPLDNDSAAENAQSAQLEVAKTISAAAKNITGVKDAAVVVTDDKRCVVALQLKSGTKLNSTLKKKITAANTGNTEIRITADQSIYSKIKTLEDRMQIGKSVSFDEVKDSWDKIQMASN